MFEKLTHEELCEAFPGYEDKILIKNLIQELAEFRISNLIDELNASFARSIKQSLIDLSRNK